MRTRISVVTACFNQVGFIEQTIRSVLGQRYPNLQYIIIDGGSTDGTIDIINRYRDDIDVVISERDDGQYYAIQKGLDIADGDVVAWINADDMYMPWTFSVVDSVFGEFPEVDWITGRPSYLNVAGQCTEVSETSSAYPQRWIAQGWYRSHLAGYLQQESMFWRRSLMQKVGHLELTLDYAADFEFWTRFAALAELTAVNVPLAAFRRRPGEQRSVDGTGRYENQVLQAAAKLGTAPWLWNWIGQQGVAFRAFWRLLKWRRGKVLTYSREQSRWVLTNSLRPISRVSFSGLLLANHAARCGRQRDKYKN